MHLHRLVALVGVLIGIVGLFLKSLVTEGEELLPTLSAQSDAFPDGIPTIWGGLDVWAQWLVVVLIVIVVVLALRPPRGEPYDTTAAGITAVAGVAMLAYAIVKYVDATDKADNLAAGFQQAAGGGAIPQAFTVEPGIGFFILILGTALVGMGGIFSLVFRNSR